MPPRNERIAAMVNTEIAKNRDVGNDVLLEKARAIDPRVRRLSPRQFHATYRLPALRAAKPRTTAAKTTVPKPAASKAASAPTAPSE